MRQRHRSLQTELPLMVGIAVESVTAYGRSVLSGVLRYANLQRKWMIHKDIWRTIRDAPYWPDCDGAIVAGVSNAMYEKVLEHTRHVVTCSGSYDPKLMPVVALDDEAAGRMAAQHLIERRLEHFAFYGPPEAAHYPAKGRPSLTAARRARGFASELRANGFSCVHSSIRLPNERDFFTHAHHPRLVEWLKNLPRPIGVFAMDDMLANDLAEACRAANVSVPDQVAIIGVNNDDLLCESAWPPLSSIEADYSRMGYLAARILDRLMRGEKLAPDERLIELPPIRVHQRASTNVLAIDHPELIEAIRYIREHACDPCTVADVLRAVPLARRNLERLFVRHLGRSPHQEIARVRMETARRLLPQYELPLEEVAQRCGFSAIQSFNRFFRQSAGLTPAKFRRQSMGDRPR